MNNTIENRRRAGVRLDGTPTNQIIAAEPRAPQASDTRRYELSFGETLIAGTLETGVVYNRHRDECEAFINGAFIYTHRAIATCIARLRFEGHIVTEIEPTDAPSTGAPVAVVSCPQIATVAVLRAHLESQGVDIQSETIADAQPLEPIEKEPLHVEKEEFARATTLDKRIQGRHEKRAFALAKQNQLDANAQAAMRSGVNKLLCDVWPDFVPVKSRSELTEMHWATVCEAIEEGRFGFGWHYKGRETAQRTA